MLSNVRVTWRLCTIPWDLYLKSWDIVNDAVIPIKTEMKCKILSLECLLRMQLWALLSQLHRHQEALYHGQIAVRISHFLMRDLKIFIKSLVYREYYAKLEKIANNITQTSSNELNAISSKPTSSRIELKSIHSVESLKKSIKSGRESARENDTKMWKGEGDCNENNPIDHDERESVESADNEIETMSILVKGYKKIYPLIEFLEKYIIQEWSDEDEGINGEPIKINHNSDSEYEDNKYPNESNLKSKGKSPVRASKLKKTKIENIINRRKRKFIKMQLNEAVKEEGVNAENLLGFINQKKICSYLNISNIMRLK